MLGFYFGSGGAKQALQEMSKALGSTGAGATAADTLKEFGQKAKEHVDTATAAGDRAAAAKKRVQQLLDDPANAAKREYLMVDFQSVVDTAESAQKAIAAATTASDAISQLIAKYADGKDQAGLKTAIDEAKTHFETSRDAAIDANAAATAAEEVVQTIV